MRERVRHHDEQVSAVNAARQLPSTDGVFVLVLGEIPTQARLAVDAVAEGVASYAIAQRLLYTLTDQAIAVVCSEATLDEFWLGQLGRWVAAQPGWSDLAFLILVDAHCTETRRRDIQRALGTVTFVPASEPSALSLALGSARRSRTRQWSLRDRLDAHSGVEAQRYADALAQYEKNLRTVFETAHQYQGLLSVEGDICYANQVALNAIDGELDDVIGRPFWDSPWFTATPGAPDAIREAVHRVAAGDSVAATLNLRMPDGDRVYDFSLRPVLDDEGVVVAMVPAAIDITTRVVAEESLRQAQKMEAVGQLTGGVAHDFNNLLTVIKSASDLLKRPDLPEVRRERYIDAISDTADRAAKLTAQLLAFARRQTLQPKVFDVAASVTAIGEMMTTLCGSRINLVIQLPEGPCYVDADPSQFETALVNLVVNARDAMQQAGKLTLRLERLEAIPAVRTHAAVQAPYIGLSVEDDGAGIARDIQDRIFEPFFTTKEVGEGTGLGLSQVIGFAKQSGGEIMVESREGEGSTFTLFLGRVDAPAGPAPDLVLDLPEQGLGSCVLVVDDNGAVGQFVTQSLVEFGYNARWVGDAHTALAALAAEPEVYDIVFSDVVMPGLDGLALGREIRRLYPGISIVLSTGYSDVLAREVDHGFDLIQKPYSVEQLSRVLRRAMASARTAPLR